MENAIDISTMKEKLELLGTTDQDELDYHKQLCQKDIDYNCVLLCMIYRNRNDDTLADYYYNKISSDQVRLNHFFDKTF